MAVQTPNLFSDIRVFSMQKVGTPMTNEQSTLNASESSTVPRVDSENLEERSELGDTKTATLVRVLKGRSDQRLYRLSTPLDGYEYVIVSAATVMGRPETYVFGATSGGDISNWSELDGSFRDELDHEKALRNAGYTVVKPEVGDG